MRFPVRAAMILGAVLWCALIVAAPMFQLGPVYAFFSLVCHQLPERSWHIHGEQLAVCIRCTSIYFGFLAGLIVPSVRPNVQWLLTAAALTLAQWLLAATVLDSVALRAATGVLLGASAAPLVLKGVEEMFAGKVRTAHGSM